MIDIEGYFVCSIIVERDHVIYVLFHQDEHVIVDNFGGVPEQGYFAIYDGHGGRGAVDFTAKTLHKVY